jgi:hypothetical protein
MIKTFFLFLAIVMNGTNICENAVNIQQLACTWPRQNYDLCLKYLWLFAVPINAILLYVT